MNYTREGMDTLYKGRIIFLKNTRSTLIFKLILISHSVSILPLQHVASRVPSNIKLSGCDKLPLEKNTVNRSKDKSF